MRGLRPGRLHATFDIATPARCTHTRVPPASRAWQDHSSRQQHVSHSVRPAQPRFNLTGAPTTARAAITAVPKLAPHACASYRGLVARDLLLQLVHVRDELLTRLLHDAQPRVLHALSAPLRRYRCAAPRPTRLCEPHAHTHRNQTPQAQKAKETVETFTPVNRPVASELERREAAEPREAGCAHLEEEVAVHKPRGVCEAHKLHQLRELHAPRVAELRALACEEGTAQDMAWLCSCSTCAGVCRAPGSVPRATHKCARVAARCGARGERASCDGVRSGGCSMARTTGRPLMADTRDEESQSTVTAPTPYTAIEDLSSTLSHCTARKVTCAHFTRDRPRPLLGPGQGCATKADNSNAPALKR